MQFSAEAEARHRTKAENITAAIRELTDQTKEEVTQLSKTAIEERGRLDDFQNHILLPLQETRQKFLVFGEKHKLSRWPSHAKKSPWTFPDGGRCSGLIRLMATMVDAPRQNLSTSRRLLKTTNY